MTRTRSGRLSTQRRPGTPIENTEDSYVKAESGKRKFKTDPTFTDASPKRIKAEAATEELQLLSPAAKVEVDESKITSLRAKKLATYSKYAQSSPFPKFVHPTPNECKLAHSILTSLHGPRIRPARVVASDLRAGCGDSPSVLDALIRTILSQNTTDINSSRAKRSMDTVYGRSDAWEAVVSGGVGKLQAAIECGGLSNVKSRVIIKILDQVYQKHQKYDLEHLRRLDNDDAMAELLSFHGVGPKTASCVLLFCLGRESFAVDTHVHRLTGLLGWRPPGASRDDTARHLDLRVPDEDKYGLHVLLVTHGKQCKNCKSGGAGSRQCELLRRYRKNEEIHSESCRQ